ncbi:hypothetical protein AVEN_43558-1 [Araneus ventricosus]|uniref:Uncharacterized protein n=1 Tax=Araneus ventricosus TaxID=182803 RepID=A0A4Y2ELX8_ARAVE|nr:hypothetical protein AVEN_43558-1 [Araneus ventricosus]
MEAHVHLHRTISFSPYLSNELKKTADATIQGNGFFAYPENIFIAMLTEKRSHIRKLGDQVKDWAPNVCCRTCATTISKWLRDKRKSMPFSVSMIWREPTNHIDDCYFCMVPPASGGFNKKKKRTIEYPNIPSALRPVFHGEGLPIPEPPTDFSISSDEEDLYI